MDLGPFPFQESQTLQQVKEKLIAEWPKGGAPRAPRAAPACACQRNMLPLPAEGPLTKETPATANDIKLIISGKFVENAKQLRGGQRELLAWCRSAPRDAEGPAAAPQTTAKRWAT